MKVSFLESRKDTRPAVEELTWPQLKSRLSSSRRLNFSSKDGLDKKQMAVAKDGPAWIPGDGGQSRSDDNMSMLSALVLDFDTLREKDEDKLFHSVAGLEHFAHTSASHRPGAPKWRIVLPLAACVEARVWRERWQAAVEHFGFTGAIRPDASAKNSSRLYYMPSHMSDVVPMTRSGVGPLLDILSLPESKKKIAYGLKAPKMAMSWWSNDILSQAARYVAKIPGAIEGARGDDRTFTVACILARDFGLTESQAMPIFLQWNSTCSPPWSEEELRTKLSHAMRYGENELGCRRRPSASGGFNRAAIEATIWLKK
jgi:hypothetical protein